MGERSPDQLLREGLAVIDQAVASGASWIAPMLSGGHDSICACFVASHHQLFSGDVHHINTGIGAKATREFVDSLCVDQGWSLKIYQSPKTYEKYVSQNGFPGPGGHRYVYAWLKERCVRMLAKHQGKVALITGVRSQESMRRMGYTKPVVSGERSFRTGRIYNKRRIWTAPCHDWSGDDQKRFMDGFGLPRNPIKMSPIGMSGECFCGAFARPGEMNMIRQICPDVAEEIDRLSAIAEAAGKPHKWGQRPVWVDPNQMPLDLTGALCHSCDQRLVAAGCVLKEGAKHA